MKYKQSKRDRDKHAAQIMTEQEVWVESSKIHPQRHKTQSCLSKFRDSDIQVVKIQKALCVQYSKIVQNSITFQNKQDHNFTKVGASPFSSQPFQYTGRRKLIALRHIQMQFINCINSQLSNIKDKLSEYNCKSCQEHSLT